MPSKESTTVTTVPFVSVRETRPACSAVSSRPWRSRVFPLDVPLGARNVVTPPAGSHRFSSLTLRSLNTR